MRSSLSMSRIASTPKDYSTQPVCNLRDVFFLPGIQNPDMQGIIFRSGKVKNLPDVIKFKTLINFCCEEDDVDTSHTTPLHFPFPDKLNVYDLHDAGTRRWCHHVLEGIAHSTFPILFHCFSGKDRTGVIACILQKIWGVSDELILQDYNNSDGDLSPELFEDFLQNVSELFLSTVNPVIITLLMESVIALPQKNRIRGGYLPRHLHVTIPSSSIQRCSWHYDIDGCGRLSRVRGRLHPTTLGISKRRIWQRVSAFGAFCDPLYEQSYQWVPVIPQELGGVNSPINEILLKRSALTPYRVAFEKCRRQQDSVYIDVTFDYGREENNMTVGLQKPIAILLKISDSDSDGKGNDGDNDSDDANDMEIIYN